MKPCFLINRLVQMYAYKLGDDRLNIRTKCRKQKCGYVVHTSHTTQGRRWMKMAFTSKIGHVSEMRSHCFTLFHLEFMQQETEQCTTKRQERQLADVYVDVNNAGFKYLMRMENLSTPLLGLKDVSMRNTQCEDYWYLQICDNIRK